MNKGLVRYMKEKKGFTLIELMIVVLIIGIIAGLSMLNLVKSKMAAHEASAIIRNGGSLFVLAFREWCSVHDRCQASGLWFQWYPKFLHR